MLLETSVFTKEFTQINNLEEQYQLLQHRRNPKFILYVDQQELVLVKTYYMKPV